MSWYDSTWNFRQPVSFDNTGGGSPIDATVTIPVIWDQFWDNVLVSGFDLRITAADGVTALAYQRQTWVHANRSAVLQIDGWAPGSSDASVQAFLYWGRVGAADVHSPFVAAAAKLGTIEASFPVGTIVDARRESPGITAPSQTIHKTSAEVLFVYILLDGILARRSTAGNKSLLYEELQWAQVRVTDGAVNQAAMYDESKTRIIENADRRYLRVQIAAGTAGEDYLIETTIRTDLGQTHELRHLLKVRNPSD